MTEENSSEALQFDTFYKSMYWKNIYRNILSAKIPSILYFNQFCQNPKTNNSVLKNKAVLEYDY